jgi:hypothetical protein
MKIIPFVLISANFIGLSIIQAQPTDKPWNNFYANQGDGLIQYQKVFEVTGESTVNIKKKIKNLLSGNPAITGISYDSNFCAGELDKISPSYYGGSKLLRGYFKIEIKEGKYRLIIDKMALKGDVFTDELSDIVLQNSGREWNSAMAHNLLPDLDGIFTKTFAIIQGDSKDW